MMNLLDGYGLLKEKRIVHNDLKPYNIFIKDKIFKIGDFGISNKLGANENFIPTECTLLYSPL
jgi:serine/threonine protein kinase